MTALTSVWLLTSSGQMVRADQVVSLWLRRSSSDDPDEPEPDQDRVLDVSVWAGLAPDRRPVQLEVVEPAHGARTLAELIAVLGQSTESPYPAAYVRYQLPEAPEPGAGLPADGADGPPGRWVLTDAPPTEAWEADLFGMPYSQVIPPAPLPAPPPIKAPGPDQYQ